MSGSYFYYLVISCIAVHHHRRSKKLPALREHGLPDYRGDTFFANSAGGTISNGVLMIPMDYK